MALEVKRLAVSPNNEETAIQDTQAFGWMLKSRNEVLNSKEKFDGAISYNGAGTIYTHTETTHFVSLLFERDTNMPHYEELAAHERSYDALLAEADSQEWTNSSKLQNLQKELESLSNEQNSVNQWKTTLIVGLVSLSICLLLGIIVQVASQNAAYWGLFGALSFIAGLLVLTGLINKRKKENPAAINKKMLDTQAAIDAIYESRKQIQSQMRGLTEEGNKILEISKKSEPRSLEVKPQETVSEENHGKVESVADELKKLKELKDEGVLTEAEFQAQKGKLLGK